MKFRDIIKYWLIHSGAMVFQRYDGTICPVSLDDPGSVTRNVVDAEIITDAEKVAIWDYRYSSTSNLITKIDLYYAPITPRKGDGGWTGHKYCYRTDWGGTGGTFNIGQGSEYASYLESSYGIINEERPFVIYLPAIRDDDTAELLLKMLVEWRSRQMRILTLDCTYSVLNIELLDKIGVTATVIPLFLQSMRWLVIGRRITPHVFKQAKVRLTLIELGGVDLPTADNWVDTFATGDNKVDTFSTGEIITEIL